jgi:foldase protein PrsA
MANGVTNLKMKIAYGIIGLSLIVAGCNKAGGSATAGGNIAVVNGDPVTMDEFNSYLPRKSSVQVQTEQGAQELRVAGSLGLQAIRDLINQKLLLQIAKDQNVVPTKDDVAKELKRQTDANAGFIKTLQAAGLSLDQIRSDLMIDLARFNVVTKGITVTPSDVDSYIKSNPTQFVNPATASVYWIVLRSAKNKPMVDKDLKSGEQFPVVAGRYSEVPTAKQDNGAYPTKVVSAMPQKLQGIIAKLEPGRTTDWIQDGQNSVKFMLQSKTPESKLEITETVREQVRRRLAEMRGQQANDLGKTIQDRLKAAKVDITVPYLKTSWDTAMQALKSTPEVPKP